MKRMRSMMSIFVVCMLLFAACTIKEEKAKASGAEGKGTSLSEDGNMNPPGVLPIVKETATLTVGMAQSTNVISYAYEDNYQTKWMQDRSNVQVDLQLFPATDANQKLNLMIASNSPLPEVIVKMGIEKDDVRFKYGQAGAIIALNDYYDRLGAFYDRAVKNTVNNRDYLSKEEMFNYTKSPDGNLYGAIYYGPTLPNSYCHRAWLNEKWLGTLGLSEPTTSEEFVNVLRAFRDNDPNGNGKKDEIPIVGSVGGWHTNPIDWLMNQFVYVDSSGYYYLLDDGELDTAFDKDEWREGLRFVKSLVDEGLLSTLSFTQDYSQYKAMVSTDPQIVGFGVSGSVSGFATNKGDYVMAGAIEGAHGVRWATYTPQLPTVIAAITRDCTSPELAFRWLDMGYETDEYPMIMSYGEPGVDWEYADSGKTMYDSLGYKPYFRIIDNIWGSSQQKHWECNPLPVISPSKLAMGEVWNGDTSNNEYKNATGIPKLLDYTPPKEDIIFKIIYTTEELDEYSELRSALLTYVSEAMVRFVMNDLDLDSDWDKYLNELQKLKYTELLAMDQKAYDRTMGR